MTSTHNPFLTTAEAADYLRLSRQFLEIARHRGDGPPYIKLARGVRYHRPSLDQWMLERQAELPPEWDREWYRDGVQTSADDLDAHYDRGGIVLMTKLVDGDRLTHINYCYSHVLIDCLKDIQQAGARFDAKAYLEGIIGDIARGGLERGRALLRLAAYTLSQPPSLTENIEKHVGVKDQKFVVGDDGRGDLSDEVFDLALRIIAAGKSEAAPATGDEPAEAEQSDKGAPLFVEDAGGLRLVDRWWLDRALAYQNGTLKSAKR